MARTARSGVQECMGVPIKLTFASAIRMVLLLTNYYDDFNFPIRGFLIKYYKAWNIVLLTRQNT